MLTTEGPASPACTHTIYRPVGGVEGLRLVHNNVSHLTVTAFPYGEDVPFRAGDAGCYILANHRKAYLGETRNIRGRLPDHFADPAKGFAREVYVISGHQTRFGKSTAVYLQHRLTVLAEQAGLVEIVKGINPQVPEVSECERAILEHYVQIAGGLLFDAGCRVFRSNFESRRRNFLDASPAVSVADDEDGTMQINVMATATLGSELELDYCGLWGRGFPVSDGFVVMAGSEVRSTVNQSANPIVTTRRRALTEAGALMPIPGLVDRLRLEMPVLFRSAAIAAKFVTGAHVNSGVWVRPCHRQPILIAD